MSPGQPGARKTKTMQTRQPTSEAYTAFCLLREESGKCVVRADAIAELLGIPREESDRALVRMRNMQIERGCWEFRPHSVDTVDTARLRC